jgi:D-sedoheptulose 7-phosphate isomerase
MAVQSFTSDFLAETQRLIQGLSVEEIESMVEVIASTRDSGGRIFFAGSGGGAGHSIHAAADFRNLARCEATAVGENVAELTALINDHSWGESYRLSLQNSRLESKDCLFVFSVGGGSIVSEVSLNLVHAITYAKEKHAAIVGVVGRDGGFLREEATASLLVPMGNSDWVTAQVEAIQALVWHLLVMHPRLFGNTPKWESISTAHFATHSK